MKKYVWICAVGLCGAPAAAAQGPAAWFAKHGRGKLEYKVLWHEGSRPQDSRKARSEFRLDLELDIPLSDQARLFLRPDVRWDTDHLSAGLFDESRRDTMRRPIFHFQEAYLEWRPGPWEFRLGEQIFAWGTADGYNPTDNLNPRDYLDLADSEKIPVFALSATYYLDEVTSLQAVLVPFFTPSRFDGQDSRWSFFPAEPPLDFDRDLPADSLSNMQVGLRARTSVRGWDFSLSYFDGYNDIGRPTLTYERFAPLGPLGPVVLRPEGVRFAYDKVRTLGFDFATTWKHVGLHGEVAHTWTDGDRDDSYLQYVLGIDYTWADIRPGQNLRLVLEYAGEEVTSRGPERDGVPPTRLGRYLDDSILARIVYELDETRKLELKGVANLRGDDNFYLQPAFTWDLRENLRLKLGADIFTGAGESFFGQFDDNDRFFLLLQYYF
ncbi:MAG: DUF1302 family protein [Candidatus Brocadiia bacterium]